MSQEQGQGKPAPEEDLSIADKLIQQLEAEYLYVQQFNIKSQNPNLQKTEPQISQNGDEKKQSSGDEEDEEPPQGYQRFDQNEESSDSQSEQLQEADLENSKPEKQNPEMNGQNLQEVGPVPDSVFAIPASIEQQIDEEKIKTSTLAMKIETPEWASDPLKIEKRLRELFGVKKF